MSGRRVEVLTAAGRARLVVAGSFDIDSRDALSRAIETLRPPPALVEIDLREVDFIDSTGLTAVLDADRYLREAGTRLRLLVSEAGPVRRLLQLTLLHLSIDVRVA